MERETKKIQLSNCEVSVITFLTWSEKENINTFLVSGAGLNDLQDFKLSDNSMINWKKNAMKVCIKGIKEGEVVKHFNDDFFEQLSVEDGDVLWSVIEELITPKKK